MSRPGSFSTVSSGITQLLQKVLIPRAFGLSNQSWTARAELSNIGVGHIDTLYVSQLNACNISADIGATIGDRTTGVAIAGDGSQQGSYSGLLRNTAGFGTEVLGLDAEHGTIQQNVLMGTRSAQQATNVTDSVLIGYLAGLTASGVAGTVAIGANALYAGRGSNNVYIGSNPITFSNVGSGNVFLGAGVGATETTTSNTLLIGNPSSVLLRGDFANGRLGVNLASAPQVTLDVSGRAWIRGDVIIDGDLTVSGGPIGSDVCTGQVIIGVGATSSNYPSLISRIGGLQVSSGYLQINRTEFPFQYHLDVSGTSRITGSNLIGGVTLSSTNVFTSGTISGVFSNGFATQNTIGGVLLSNSKVTVNASGSIQVGTPSFERLFIDASGDAAGGRIRLLNDNASYNAELYVPPLGSTSGASLTLREAGFNSSNNPRAVLTARDSADQSAELKLFNSIGNETVTVYGNATSNAGAVTIRNSNGNVTFTLSGSSGSISNSNTSSNRIGGVELYGGDLTLFSNTTETFGVDGASGAISNAPGSTNSIGGVTLGPDGVFTASFGAIVNSNSTSNQIGGIRLSNTNIVTSGTIEAGAFGAVSGVKLGPGSIEFSSVNVLNYITLGHVYDSQAGLNYFSYNFQYTGTSGYRNVNSDRRNTFNSIALSPRVRVDIYDNSNATGTVQSYSNTSTTGDTYCNVTTIDKDYSYRAYFF